MYPKRTYGIIDVPWVSIFGLGIIFIFILEPWLHGKLFINTYLASLRAVSKVGLSKQHISAEMNPPHCLDPGAEFG